MEHNKEDNLYQRLSKIREELNNAGLEKDGKNVLQNYNYYKTDDIKRVVSPLLCKYGVELFMQQTDVRYGEAIKNINVNATILGKLVLVNIDKPSEYIELVLASQAGDTGDKALQKAKTAMLKSYFTDSMMVNDGIDPDEELKEIKGPSPERTAKAKDNLKGHQVQPPATQAAAPTKTEAAITKPDVPVTNTEVPVTPAANPVTAAPPAAAKAVAPPKTVTQPPLDAKPVNAPAAQPAAAAPKTAAAPVAPKAAPPAMPGLDGPMSDAQVTLCKRILDRIAMESGSTGPRFDEVSYEHKLLKTRQQAVDFNNKWRGISGVE